MKKETALNAAFAACVIVSAFAAVSAGAGVDGALSIYSLTVSPQPVYAGSNIIVSFKIFNSYVNPLKNVNIDLVSQNQILNVSPASTTLVGTIGSGEFGGPTTNIFTYVLHMPSTLTTGFYTLYLDSSYDAIYGTSSATYDQPGTSSDPIYIYVYGMPDIRLAGTPVSITPGGQTVITLTASNLGTDAATNASVTVLNSTYFTAYGSNTVYLGTISAGAATTATLTLQTAANLSAGTFTVPMRVSYTSQDGRVNTSTVNMPINFVTGKPYIKASIQAASPQQLYSGSNQTLTVLLQNIGQGTAKNVSVSFMSTNAIDIDSATATTFIGTIKNGSSTTVPLFISASENLNGSLYRIPVTFTYQRSGYKGNITQAESIPVTLKPSAVFQVEGVTASLAPGAAYSKVSYAIKNIGNEAAQQVSLSLQTIYPVTPVNSNFYINDLQPGQTANAVFYVNVDSAGAAGQYPVTLYEQWRQPNGYTNEQYSSSDGYYVAVGQGGSILSGLGGLAVLLVIAIAAVGAYRYRKKIMQAVKERSKQRK